MLDMAKRKINLKLSYDAPVTLTFSLVCIVLFLVDNFLLKNFLGQHIFCSPTAAKGPYPFSFSEFISYPRLILYVFGSKSFVLLFTNLIYILLLGPSVEEQYGSVVIGIMIAVSALFSGVLNASFCSATLQGTAPIVFTMIFLNAFMTFSRRKIPVSFIVVMILYILIGCLDKEANGFIGTIVNMAGGLCGSLFAFLASPKARADSKYNKAIQEVSPVKTKTRTRTRSKVVSKKKKPAAKSSNDDETVVGTLKF